MSGGPPVSPDEPVRQAWPARWSRRGQNAPVIATLTKRAAGTSVGLAWAVLLGFMVAPIVRGALGEQALSDGRTAAVAGAAWLGGIGLFLIVASGLGISRVLAARLLDLYVVRLDGTLPTRTRRLVRSTAWWGPLVLLPSAGGLLDALLSGGRHDAYFAAIMVGTVYVGLSLGICPLLDDRRRTLADRLTGTQVVFGAPRRPHVPVPGRPRSPLTWTSCVGLLLLCCSTIALSSPDADLSGPTLPVQPEG